MVVWDMEALALASKEINDLEEAKKIIQALFKVVRNQTEKIERLEAEIRRLKSTPPRPKFSNILSTDALKKSSSKKSGKKRSKRKQIHVDELVELKNPAACNCGSSELKTIRTKKKVVQGIKIARHNIGYYWKEQECTKCNKLHKPELPTEIRNQQYSLELRSWVSILKYDCRFSEGMISKLFNSLDIEISSSEVGYILQKNSKSLIKSYEEIKIWGIRKSNVLHTDVTAMKSRSTQNKIENNYLHILSNSAFSWAKITNRYNKSSVHQVLGKRASSKVIISDDHTANNQWQTQQLCWVHEIRHFLKIEPGCKGYAEELEEVVSQLWKFYRLGQEYGNSPTKRQKQSLKIRFGILIEKEVKNPELKRQLVRTARKKEKLLRFLDYEGVPLDNNQAERDLRHAVILRKLSGGTKSPEGEKSFSRHLSVIQTIKKSGLDLIETFTGLLSGRLSPDILTQHF